MALSRARPRGRPAPKGKKKVVRARPARKRRARPSALAPVLARRRMRPGRDLWASLRTPPSLTSSEVVTVDYETRKTFTFNAGSNYLLIFAPHNDVIGLAYSQAAAPVNNATAVVPDATNPITSATIASVFATAAPTAGANAPISVRHTRFCVEVVNQTALASVSGMVRSGVSLSAIANPAAAQDYYNLVSLTVSDRRTDHLSAGSLVAARCRTAAMLDQVGLSFNTVQSGQAAWIAEVYRGADVAGTDTFPWAPLVFVVDGQSAPSSIDMVIKGTMQFRPPTQSFLSNLARPVRVAPPTSYLRANEMILASKSTAALDGRTASGILGTPM